MSQTYQLRTQIGDDEPVVEDESTDVKALNSKKRTMIVENTIPNKYIWVTGKPLPKNK